MKRVLAKLTLACAKEIASDFLDQGHVGGDSLEDMF
jgi:hypothetical protein